MSIGKEWHVEHFSRSLPAAFSMGHPGRSFRTSGGEGGVKKLDIARLICYTFILNKIYNMLFAFVSEAGMAGSTMILKSNENRFLIDATKEREQTDSFQEICKRIDRERARADQHGGRFSLVVFSIGISHGFTYAAHILWKIVTRSNRDYAIGWFDEYHPGVIIPEAFPAGAAHFAAGVCLEIPSKIQLDFSVFSYPGVWLDDYREYSRAIGMYSGSNQAFSVIRANTPHALGDMISETAGNFRVYPNGSFESIRFS
jgi:hypothetical protein